MTYEQAHKILEDKQREMTKNRGLYAADDISANGEAIEALEKQIPKKPMIRSKRHIPRHLRDYMCPCCNVDVVGTGFYCWHCGQRLDWGAEK